MSATPPIPVRAGEFDGPLDLLLELVRRNQLSLESLPIAEITGPYLAYMREAHRASVDLGADFIYMAATLIQIKSRMLLPQDPALRRTPSASADDTAEGLIARLREHERARVAAEMLKTKLAVEETVWSRQAGGDPELVFDETLVEDSLTAKPRQATLADLIDTLGETLRRVRNSAAMAMETDPFTVEDRIRWLRSRVDSNGNPLAISELFGEQPSHVARCCLFLGMLELGRDGQLNIEQSEPFGEVLVGRL
jgi:segregation and condensation protein A